ncbi:2OG-Fe(II) oxygenase [Inhella sp. 4Y17]|uniref:2OG-Fe(II) oxygenase n=1 Tax=Inhella gelatinilytica TaxID=2795030 RepID=A0A931J0A9_9BURK|nr:2OG-Fe(II) oxygenase [Inhella gelatinilytica]
MPDFIEVYENALSPVFCQQLIQQFDQSPHRVQGRTGGGVDVEKKLSSDLYLKDHPEWRPALAEIQKVTTYIAAEYFRKYHFALIAPFGLTVGHPETGEPVAVTHDNFAQIGDPQALDLMRTLYRLGPVQMQKYDRGQGNYNYWHCETYPGQPDCETLHRALLFMFYLNDVEDGGETEFYYQARSLKPRAGTMVIAPAGFTHTHRGCTPRSGDKYILTSWILFQRAEKLYGSA